MNYMSESVCTYNFYMYIRMNSTPRVIRITLLQERDAGIYECQIPTQPPQSYQIKLDVIGI